MNWIRIAVGIGRDPSIIGMARTLGVSTPLTTGCCVLVMAELPTVSRGGDLSGVSDDALECWAQWAGKRGKFATAFRSHLCTPEGVLRAWDKHNGSAIRESDRRAEVMRARRALPHRAPAVTGNDGVTVTVTPALTGRDGTGRTTTTQQQPHANVADAPPAGLSLVPESPPAKAPRPRTTTATAAFPHFPVTTCQAMYGLWTGTFGAVDYARFRKTFGPLFTLPEPDRRSDDELLAALKSYADLAPMGDGARFASVTRAAECLSAIATVRRDHADDPSTRTDAIMRIIHGRRIA